MIIKISSYGGQLEEFIILELQGHVLPTKPPTALDANTAASGRKGGAGVVDPDAKLDGLLIGNLQMKPVSGWGLWVGWHSGACPPQLPARAARDLTDRPSPSTQHRRRPMQDGKGLLQVGNHRVTGSLETLAKPLVLIDRAPADPDVDGELYGPGYVVRGVIRKRLRFEDRPQPIVGAANKRAV